MAKLILHTDGAAKGNPGPSGIGIVLYRDGEAEPFVTIGESIGEATNNVAEYRALVRGLGEALERGASEIEVRTDSELMARQIEGRYKVTSPLLLPLHAEARRLLSRFDRARIIHVLRGKNALADELANQGVAAGLPEKKPARKGKPKEETTPWRSPFRHTHSTRIGDESHVWNVERLWELARDLPVKAVPVETVATVLDEDCWFGGKAPTGREVMTHAQRIYEADFSHPIILSASGRVMDGGHRIARALLLDKKEIDAVQFPEDPEPDIRRLAEPPMSAR